MDVSALQPYAAEFLRFHAAPGLAVLMTDRQRTLHESYLGLADLATGRPVTAGTLFPLGSATKTFTAALALQEHEAGRLDLNLPVREYLPWFDVDGPVTAHHLLTHTAGLPNGRYDIPSCLSQALSLAGYRLPYAPGAHFHYSNLGYAVLTALLEQVSGRSYAELVQSRILDPLGMTGSRPQVTADVAARLGDRLATGYQPLYDDRPDYPGRPIAPVLDDLRIGDGSIAATAVDAGAFLRMLLNGGRGVLSPASLARMTAPAVPAYGRHYGYGLQVRTDGGNHVVSHNGNTLGHAAYLMADLTLGVGVVVLLNCQARGFIVRDYALALLRAAARGEPAPPPPPLDWAYRVAGGAEYAGTYGPWVVTTGADDRLLLHSSGQAVPLEQRGPDTFFAAHPDFDRFALTFGRNADGAVTEAFHGPDRNMRAGYDAGQTDSASPPQWEALPGHYRAMTPFWHDFRVFLRRGRLCLVHPFAGDSWLEPLPDGSFRPGPPDWSPERIRFDTVVNGRAQRLLYSGAAYYRVAD